VKLLGPNGKREKRPEEEGGSKNTMSPSELERHDTERGVQGLVGVMCRFVVFGEVQRRCSVRFFSGISEPSQLGTQTSFSELR
jgi:hypothetical protein